MDALKMISNASLKQEVPAFSVGDTVKVHVRIKEGDKSRIQVFEGTVIAKKHGGIHETFTVRRVAYGCGMERVFPLHSPVVDKVEVIRRGKVRRAKLYYLRDRVGKAAKVKEQIGEKTSEQAKPDRDGFSRFCLPVSCTKKKGTYVPFFYYVQVDETANTCKRYLHQKRKQRK